MKKVLALVLAVIMVCTMAMAIDVTTIETSTGTTGTVTNDAYTVLTPGKSIVLSAEELGYEEGVFGYYTDKHEFVPAKNTVTVTLEKGADLIASQGWVKDVDGNYFYVLTTKENNYAALDQKADIIITKIVAKAYGTKTANTFELKATTGDYKDQYVILPNDNLGLDNLAAKGYRKLDDHVAGYTFVGVFDYGFTANTYKITGKNAEYNYSDANTLLTVEKSDKQDDGKYYTSASWTLANGELVATRTMKAGETVFYANVAMPTANSAADKALNKNLTDKEAEILATLTGVVPDATVELSLEKAPEGAKMYMVKADGSVVDLGAKFDADGVLVATAKLTGPVIVTDKALTASAGTNGTTTNPGTGANDVVGVAAALAVVALVSGAAISLKK